MPLEAWPQALKRARAAAGLSQRALAQRAGMHQPQVARAESGGDMQVSGLIALSRALGLELCLLSSAPKPGETTAIPGAIAKDRSRDAIDASFDGWRQAWPRVDPEVFGLLARLARAGRHVEQAMAAVAATGGMNTGELMLLGALRRAGPPYECTPTGLKQRLWLTLPGIKKRLDALLALGMIERFRNAADRRGRVVRITPRGHATLDRMVAQPQARLYAIVLDMLPEDRAQLSARLRQLLQRVDDDRFPANRD